jgi:hypothetical protein
MPRSGRQIVKIRNRQAGIERSSVVAHESIDAIPMFVKTIGRCRQQIRLDHAVEQRIAIWLLS